MSNIKSFLFLVVVTLFLSAATATAMAQEPGQTGAKSARDIATEAAKQNKGRKICYAEGVNKLFSSKDEARNAVYATGELLNSNVGCVTSL